MRFAPSILVVCFVALALSLGWSASANSADKTPSPQSLEELDAALEKVRIDSGIPGMGVAIIESGAVVLAKGYGLADVANKTPATADTLFRAGSISKAFIGLSAMMLVEEGKLSLDTPMSEALPDIPVVNPYAKEAPIRLVHLLEHTSGWADYSLRQFNADGRGLSLSDAVLKDAPYVSRYAPGQFAAYSNPGAAAAALMVERATDGAYGDFVWARLFKPMGMLSATFDKPERGLATSYLNDGRTPAPYTHLSAPPIGGLNVSVRDLALYPLLMLGRGTLNGQVYLKPESILRIERGESSTAYALGLVDGYGLGNFGTGTPRGVFRGHDGAIDGAASQAGYWPGHGAGYVLMWTKQIPNPAGDIIRTYLTRNASDVTPKAQTPPPTNLAALAGRYQSIADRQPLVSAITTLLDNRVVSVEGGTLKIDDEDYVATGPNLFQRLDRSAPTVVFDTSGRTPKLFHTLGAYQQIPPDIVWRRVAWATSFAALSLFAVFHILGWLWALARGRLKSLGGVGLRLLPLMALGSVYALAVLLIWLGSFGNAVLIPSLGSQSVVSISIFVASLMIPVLGFLSFWRGLTAGYGASTWIRLYAMAAGALTLIAAAYLHQYGWIGIQTWAL